MSQGRRNPPSKTTGRFARVAAAAIFDPRMSAAALRVLAAFASYASADNTCFPAIETVADRLGLTRRMVQLHLRSLEAAGYVEREATRRSRGGSGANLYTLQFPVSGAKPGFAPPVKPGFAPSGAKPSFALTRSLNKTIGTRAPADMREGDEWGALCERLKARHGFSHARACKVAATACLQAGGAARLDTLMAAAEAGGTSAHDRIMAAFAGAEAA